jgi:lipopolysaccharide export system permease protein
MRLLDRYLLRELMIPLAYCLVGFLVFWVAFDLFSELGDYQSRGMSVGSVTWLYLLKVPELLVVVLPVGLLLAMLYALTNHARHHELTAIMAAGVGLWRLFAPYLGVGLAASLFLLAANELWVPANARRAELLLQAGANDAAEARRSQWVQPLNFYNARDRRFWRVHAYNLKTHEMLKPRVDWDRSDGTSVKVIADRAVRTNGAWRFLEVQQFTQRGSDPIPQRVVTNALALPEFGETPDQIRSEIAIARMASFKTAKQAQLSIREIRRYLAWHPGTDRPEQVWMRTLLQARLAAPWTCLVVTLIAIPFGAPAGRRNVFVGVASSLFICFAFFVLRELSLAFGAGGHMPAWLAAWMPNLCFAAAGLGLMRRVRG